MPGVRIALIGNQLEHGTHDRPADGAGTRVEVRPPESIADDDDARRAGFVFFVGKSAADGRRHAEGAKHVRRDEAADEALRLRAARQVHDRPAVQTERLEHLILRAPVLKVLP